MISIVTYGISLWMFVGIVISALNIFCVGFAVWKLDVMRGERGFYSWRYVVLLFILVMGR